MKLLALIPILILAMGGSSTSMAQIIAETANDIEGGRYVRVKAAMSRDAQAQIANPMTTIVSLTFPRETVVTVGDAVVHLLKRSGYGVDAELGGDAHARLMAFDLPESQRRLDYVTVEQALALLGGWSYAPSIDHIHRTVAYGLKPTGGEDPNTQIAATGKPATQLAQSEK